MGVGGVAAVTSFTSQVSASIDDNSRVLFGGDLAVSDVQTLADVAKYSQSPGVVAHTLTSTMTAMLQNGSSEDSRLVTVTAADIHYPLLPRSLQLDPPGQFGQIAQSNGVFLSRDLAQEWGLELGSTVRLAGHDLTVQGVIIDDLTRGASLFALGPAVLMQRADAQRLGLLGKTSRFRETLTLLVDADALALAEEFRKTAGPQSSIRITTKDDRDRGPARVLGNLSVFLSQVTLSTFLLVSLGLSTVLAEMIRSRRNDMAIYRVLGAPPRLPVLVMLSVIVATCALGALSGLVLGEILRAGALVPALEGLLPLDLAPFRWTQIPILVPLWGIAVPVLAVWPLLRRLEETPPAMVLRGPQEQENLPSTGTQKAKAPKNSRAQKALYGGVFGLLLLLPFVALSELTRERPWIGLVVFATNMVLFWLFHRILKACLQLANKATGRLPLAVELAIGELSARRLTSFLIMSLVGIGLFFITLMVLVQRDLAQSLNIDIATNDKPNLYFLDVQRSQADELSVTLKQLVASSQSPEIVSSPMVRARLLSVDGKDTSRRPDLEDETSGSRSRDLRQREQNLTWRNDITTSERLRDRSTKRETLWEDGDHAQVSLEERFAERIGASLGSTLVFSVSGVPLKVRVTSLREVYWQSFRPNFFVVLHPELMTHVPHQVLMSIHASPAEQRRSIQNTITKSFPNVSVIDAAVLIDRAASIAKSVTDLSALLTGLLIVAGLTILTGTLVATAAARMRTAAILRTLGAKARMLRWGLLTEFLILGGASGALGVAAAQGVGVLVVRYVLELTPTLSISSVAVVWIAGTVVTCLTGYLTSRALSTRQPAAILRESL
jgi:putative ABC transport system permease protein